MGDPDDPSVARRGFFREALAGILRPLASAAERHAERRQPVRLLRPPGALAEDAFANTCQRCGNCAQVCPARAIFALGDSGPELSDAVSRGPDAPPPVAGADGAGTAFHPTAAEWIEPSLVGTPVIDPSLAACVVCSELACTHVCPSGALRPLARPDEIRMGLAIVRPDVCVRGAGEPCVECVERCPIGPAAIRFPDEGPPMVLEACVGCGVCELYCPTTPKAIWIEPRATTRRSGKLPA